jgi:hypothetical protein
VKTFSLRLPDGPVRLRQPPSATFAEVAVTLIRQFGHRSVTFYASGSAVHDDTTLADIDDLLTSADPLVDVVWDESP